MKICAISDLHGQLPNNLPESDLLLIAGDLVPLDIQMNLQACKLWFNTDFKQWCKNQITYSIVIIGGNHDFVLEKYPEECKEIFESYNENSEVGKWFYYLDNEVEDVNVNGSSIKIYGTQYCHKFGNWAFMPSEEKSKELFKVCPDKVDIILAHDAPYGVTDICEEHPWGVKDHIGSKPLRELIDRVDFKYLLHGHLHSTEHKLTPFAKDSLVANVSLLNEQYKLVYPPLIFDYEL